MPRVHNMPVHGELVLDKIYHASQHCKAKWECKIFTLSADKRVSGYLAGIGVQQTYASIP